MGIQYMARPRYSSGRRLNSVGRYCTESFSPVPLSMTGCPPLSLYSKPGVSSAQAARSKPV